MIATRFSQALRCLCLLLAITATGCGPVQIEGGTPGRLSSGGNPIRDVELSLYPAAAAQRIGYGVTGPEGDFHLITADSVGSLDLPPGSYRVTLESIGAPVELPSVYADRQSTPLHVAWPAGERIELDVPGLKLQGN